MSDRLDTISKLRSNLNERAAYIRAKLAVLVPSQIKALRLKSGMARQADLAREAEMHQSRISMFETPGAANMTIETLSRLAATFKTGLIIKFVPFSEMLEWENEFSQDSFDVLKIEHDADFIEGRPIRVRRRRKAQAVGQFAHMPSISGRLWPNVARGSQVGLQMDLFPSLESYARDISMRASGQIGRSNDLELLNKLFMIGGTADGCQEYNPASTTPNEKRAIA